METSTPVNGTPVPGKKRRGRPPVNQVGPDAIDVHVGKRIRARRTLCGIPQEKLAAELGITFQQVQKYESGANRISASRMFDTSLILGVPPAYFFEDMPEELRKSRTAQELSPFKVEGEQENPMDATDVQELLRDYWRLSEDKQVALRRVIYLMSREG